MTDKQPCPACPSSDGFAVYEDGHGHCFVCGHHTHGDGTESTKPRKKMATNLIPLEAQTFQQLSKRKLTEETCKHWSYGTAEYAGKPVHVANYRDETGTVVAQKVRFANKDFLMLGEPKKAGLYGQHLWRNGGRKVVVTEGEIDALTFSQTQGNKWPVVSVPSGSKGAKGAIQASLEWLSKFDEVVLMFDNDEPGREAVAECAPLFEPGKCKIATLPLKDASDMLQAGRVEELVNAMWSAKEFRPDGVVAGTDLWESIVTEKKNDSVPYPWMGLNNLTHGRRRGELVLLTAGSGMGKSEVAGQIAYDGLMNHGETLGYIALEESTKRTALRLMGLNMGKKLHVDREGVTEMELRQAFDDTVGSGRVYLYDHFGSTDSANLINKIRYMVKGLGATTVVLDHISIVVSGIGDGDERRIIDNVMTSLATLVKETDVRLILICHLKKPDGTPHEEGGRVTLDDLRGSGSLKQLVDIVLGLERNQQDEVKKNWTLIRVLKNRFTGETGEACWLKWDTTSGRLSEGIPEFEIEEEQTNNNPF